MRTYIRQGNVYLVNAKMNITYAQSFLKRRSGTVADNADIHYFFFFTVAVVLRLCHAHTIFILMLYDKIYYILDNLQ